MSASSAAKKTGPLAFQLEVEFLDRLNEPVRDGRAASVSALIREALARFNLEQVVVVRPSQLTISVRLPVEIRRQLKSVAKAKHTSIGQLVRAAAEAYLPTLESDAAADAGLPIPQVELPEAEEPAPPAAPARKRQPTKKRRAKPAPSPRSPKAKAKRPAPKRKGMTRKRTRG